MKKYIAWHDRRQIVVEAESQFQAQRLAAFKFGLKDSKAHYVVVRSAGYNAHSDRYTGVSA